MGSVSASAASGSTESLRTTLDETGECPLDLLGEDDARHLACNRAEGTDGVPDLVGRSVARESGAPGASTLAERRIGTLRRELLDRTIIWNQRQLERLVTDYIDHSNEHRPLDLQPPGPADEDPLHTPESAPQIARTTRCDGLINEYRNAA